ncbi:hypothetical protein CRG98_004529 [Punica granatum]|uniref:Uncharacterized protein n=1 Tax=Punica granatum TaxID=22663 RepID=A0A2I0L2X8_PUNGR|nr:hypothetical protein CRG98_004529 [Punica granatum]
MSLLIGPNKWKEKQANGYYVAEHLGSFQEFINQLTNVKVMFDDEIQALLLFNSLLDDWGTLVVSLNDSAPNKLSIEIIKDSLSIRRPGDKCKAFILNQRPSLSKIAGETS